MHGKAHAYEPQTMKLTLKASHLFMFFRCGHDSLAYNQRLTCIKLCRAGTSNEAESTPKSALNAAQGLWQCQKPAPGHTSLRRPRLWLRSERRGVPLQPVPYIFLILFKFPRQLALASPGGFRLDVPCARWTAIGYRILIIVQIYLKVDACD